MQRRQLTIRSLLKLLTGAVAIAAMACGGGASQPDTAAEVSPTRAGIKIPITTRSDDALDLYLEADPERPTSFQSACLGNPPL